MNISSVEFIKSAATAPDIIRDGLPQIVFSGKSNVGKSSVINMVLSRKNLARVSSTPGKTVHINYFMIDKTAYFVDLPGYGYAKTAKKERARWSKLMEEYFSAAGHIALAVMIVDARHMPTANDCTMAEWFKYAQCRLIVAANKIDKVKNSEKDRNMSVIRQTLELNNETKVIPLSAEKGTNRELLLASIDDAVKEWCS